MSRPKTFAQYLKASPPQARAKLREMRAILKKVAPHADEAIKWGAPAFIEKRILFVFAAYKSHINFMPTPKVMRAFALELKKYTLGKGTIQFSYDQPLPKALIRKIAAYRARDVRENDALWM